MNSSYFEFIKTDAEGRAIDSPIRVNTEQGIILQCDARIPTFKIKHLCSLARAAPGWPVDITHFDNDGGALALVWSARIYYKEGEHNGKSEPVRPVRKAA